MGSSIIKSIGASSKEKLGLFSNKGKYFVLSIMAGVFIGIASVFSYSAGALVYENLNTAHLYPFAIAFPFALTLILVVFLGAELFPGNILFMSVSVLQKSIELKKALALLAFCFLGNVVGCALVSIMYYSSGLVTGAVSDLVLLAATTKLSYSFYSSFILGALCNILICLSVLMCHALKTETAKIIAIIFLINAFMISGFENSIANVATFSLFALLSRSVSPLAILLNCLATVLGQVCGGALFVALPIWFTTRNQKQTS